MTMQSLDGMCDRRERRCAKCKSDHNDLAQYSSLNNGSCIPRTPGHRSLPQIWKTWQTKIEKDNCKNHK